MHFEAQQSFSKHSGSNLKESVHYGDNSNFMKKYKLTPNMWWLLLWVCYVNGRLRRLTEAIIYPIQGVTHRAEGCMAMQFLWQCG
jgi:hypothetical protein